MAQPRPPVTGELHLHRKVRLLGVPHSLEVCRMSPVAASLCTPTVCHFRRASRWNVFSVFGLRVLFATTTHVRGVGFDSISALDEDINGRRPVSIANQGQQYPGLYIYIYIYPTLFCCVDSTCGHSEPTRHLRVDRFIFPPSSRQDECGAYRRSPDGDSARGAG